MGTLVARAFCLTIVATGGLSCSHNLSSSGLEVPQLSLISVIPQDVEGRIFPDTIRTREVFRVPNESDSLAGHFFYSPGTVRADARDNIYVIDFGVIKVHRFDSNGDYAASYGLGIVVAPESL